MSAPMDLDGAERSDYSIHGLLDDEMAQLFGDMILAYLAERMMRGLWLLVYPVVLSSVLAGDNSAKRFEEAFKRDKLIFTA